MEARDRDLRNGTVTVVWRDCSAPPQILMIFAEMKSLAARALDASLSVAVQHLRAAQKIKPLAREAWWNWGGECGRALARHCSSKDLGWFRELQRCWICLDTLSKTRTLPAWMTQRPVSTTEILTNSRESESIANALWGVPSLD